MSAAKRYRLRCLKAVILALHNSEHLALNLPASEDSDTMSASERANQVSGLIVQGRCPLFHSDLGVSLPQQLSCFLLIT